MTRSTITSFVSVKLYVAPPQQAPKHSRNGGIICHAAVSKPVHLAKACTPASDRATEARGGGGEGQLTEPGKTVLFTGPDTQSRNAFKQWKERKRKKGGRGGVGERRRGGMKAGGICASLWETVLVLIYTSMARAQNELWEQNNQKQEIIKKRLWLKEEKGRSEGWLLLTTSYCETSV